MTIAIDSALTKPKVYETKRIQLTSPILHIGSEVQKLNPFEYVVSGNRVYLPDLEALARKLKERGRLQDFIERIEARRIEDRDITPLLKATFGENWRLEKDGGNPIFPRTRSSLKWTEQQIADLRPMIRNGFGQLYIPGTSIKGAIRTAIAYHLIKHADKYNIPQQQHRSEIETKLLVTIGELRQKPKRVDDGLFMDELFTNFRLRSDRGNTQKCPNTDFMRAVHVTDSEPLIEEKLTNKQGKPVFINLPVAVEVIIVSHESNWKAKYKAPIYTEMVRNVNTEFSIALDQKLLNEFYPEKQIPFRSVDDILKICQEFAQAQWEYERQHWQEKMRSNPNARDRNNRLINLDLSFIQQDFYGKEDCPHTLRLGWASGMIGTTINHLFKDETRQKIRENFCRQQASGYEAPKSRRVVTNPEREIKYAPGWVKFKVLSTTP